jgi:hypothetical protein
MKKRKFEVLSVTLNPGGPGPERAWDCMCRFIEDKKYIERKLMAIGRTADEAKRSLELRYGGKN